MKICTGCGNKLGDDEKKCSVCNTKAKNFPLVDDNDTEKANEIVEAVKTKNLNRLPQANKKRGKGCLTFIILVIVGFIVVGLNLGDSPLSGGPKHASGLELVGETTSENNGYAIYINGSIKNNSKKNYSYAQVTFGIYDDNGAKIGTALDNVTNLGAGETWTFKAMSIEAGVSGGKYRLDEITGY